MPAHPTDHPGHSRHRLQEYTSGDPFVLGHTILIVAGDLVEEVPDPLDGGFGEAVLPAEGGFVGLADLL